MNHIADLRKEYSSRTLEEQQMAASPHEQFAAWFQEALAAELPEPNAMHLATASADGFPSGRVVLLKGLDDGGFSFYTNYQSRKGRELEENPKCALTFFWPELERQVRIEGLAQRLPDEKSDAYFKSRPRESQIGAWASPQSSVIVNREILEARMRDLLARYSENELPERPRQWGGFVVVPHAVEFWQGRPSRLHDRIRYVRTETSWQIQRLAP